MSASRFHIISIHLRRAPGDTAYRIRESFDAESLQAACARHAAFKLPGVRCSVLREAATGQRFSMEQSIYTARATGATE